MMLDKSECQLVALMTKRFFELRKSQTAQEALGTTEQSNEDLDSVAGELYAGLQRRGWLEYEDES